MAKKHVNPEFEPPYPQTTKQTVGAYNPLISTLTRSLSGFEILNNATLIFQK